MIVYCPHIWGNVDPDPQPIWDGPYQEESKMLIIEMGIYHKNPIDLDDIRTDWENILKDLED